MDISYVRGNVLLFSTQFFDAEGGVVLPTTVDLRIRTAPLGAGAEDLVLPMTVTDDVWSVQWDTTGIAPGLVYWSVRAESPSGAEDGDFVLEANWANT